MTEEFKKDGQLILVEWMPDRWWGWYRPIPNPYADKHTWRGFCSREDLIRSGYTPAREVIT